MLGVLVITGVQGLWSSYRISP